MKKLPNTLKIKIENWLVNFPFNSLTIPIVRIRLGCFSSAWEIVANAFGQNFVCLITFLKLNNKIPHSSLLGPISCN